MDGAACVLEPYMAESVYIVCMYVEILSNAYKAMLCREIAHGYSVFAYMWRNLNKPKIQS